MKLMVVEMMKIVQGKLERERALRALRVQKPRRGLKVQLPLPVTWD